MQKTLSLLAIFCLAVVGLSAQDLNADLPAYSALMKAAAKANGGVRSAIMAKDTAAAAASAKEMATSFDAISAWFKAKGKDDGAKFAETASAAAKAVAAATTTEDQQAAFMKARPTCGGCHMVYRDGQNDKFKS